TCASSGSPGPVGSVATSPPGVAATTAVSGRTVLSGSTRQELPVNARATAHVASNRARTKARPRGRSGDVSNGLMVMARACTARSGPWATLHENDHHKLRFPLNLATYILARLGIGRCDMMP